MRVTVIPDNKILQITIILKGELINDIVTDVYIRKMIGQYLCSNSPCEALDKLAVIVTDAIKPFLKGIKGSIT